MFKRSEQTNANLLRYVLKTLSSDTGVWYYEIERTRAISDTKNSAYTNTSDKLKLDVYI